MERFWKSWFHGLFLALLPRAGASLGIDSGAVLA
jgi:hypothetical protein